MVSQAAPSPLAGQPEATGFATTTIRITLVLVHDALGVAVAAQAVLGVTVVLTNGKQLAAVGLSPPVYAGVPRLVGLTYCTQVFRVKNWPDAGAGCGAWIPLAATHGWATGLFVGPSL